MRELPDAEREPRRTTRPRARSRWTGTAWVYTDGHWMTNEYDTPSKARVEWMRERQGK
jgi:hypothetical protein